MIDLHAPIEPGRAAAGLSVGAPIERLGDVGRPSRTELQDGIVLLDFGPVRVWARANVIEQIGVQSAYVGCITDTRIGIGATIQQVIDAIGPVMEDEQDNLVLANRPGLAFDTTEWRRTPDGADIADNLDATITEIVVYAPNS